MAKSVELTTSLIHGKMFKRVRQQAVGSKKCFTSQFMMLEAQPTLTGAMWLRAHGQPARTLACGLVYPLTRMGLDAYPMGGSHVSVSFTVVLLSMSTGTSVSRSSTSGATMAVLARDATRRACPPPRRRGHPVDRVQ